MYVSKKEEPRAGSMDKLPGVMWASAKNAYWLQASGGAVTGWRTALTATYLAWDPFGTHGWVMCPLQMMHS